METPILALTRARDATRPGLSPASAEGRNMRLLVQLRWIAVGGQLLTIAAAHWGLGVALPIAPMLAVIAVLAGVNVYARQVLYRRPIGQAAIFLALLFDVVALALQLYLSGGTDNPFVSLFFLQLVLGAILLDAGLAAALAGVTAASYAALAAFGVSLAWPPERLPEVPLLETLGAGFSFLLTGALTVGFVARVIRNLRARDAYLAELRRQAAEEDGIVRLGLLASGAAHELGTPLSSLSVILNDWSRMPRLTGDADMAKELAEMRREVDRSKAIVGDILHTAGTPRSEDVGLMTAEAVLDDVLATWRSTHPATTLTYAADDLQGAWIVAQVPVRQVIVSLLDNAAEASPSSVALTARRTPSGLEIAVTDQGPGFTADRLHAIGKPYQSSKGAGRGLGLFLAAALARRLGGRLVAANRPEGGAEVKLSLPLAPDPVAEDG